MTTENKFTFENFKKIYDENRRMAVTDVNLFHSIHLSENDHTNILWDILRYTQNGEHIFYKSFVEDVLCIDDNSAPQVNSVFSGNNNINRSGTQYQAIALNNNKTNKENKGFIDLVLNDYVNKSVIIIENKVCGASDGEKQLARYYFSFVKPKQGDDTNGFFEKSEAHWTKEELKDHAYEKVFVVYLTKDGSKEPCTDSISEELRKNMGDNYIPVSYADSDNSKGKSILSWFKEDVLPKITYNENGFLINSVKLYIEYIESELLGVGHSYDDHYDHLLSKATIADCYTEARRSRGGNEEETIFNDYQNCALFFAEKKIRGLLPEGWNVHCAGTFLLIYKEDWRKYEKRKYTIPTFCIALNNSQLNSYLQNSETELQWQFQIEHISVDEQRKQIFDVKQQDVAGVLMDCDEVIKTNHYKTNVYKNVWKARLNKDDLKSLCSQFDSLLSNKI